MTIIILPYSLMSDWILGDVFSVHVVFDTLHFSKIELLYSVFEI